VTAVAVWKHRPTADELLKARLARGWVPTPTAMQDGQVILGHAACLVSGSLDTAS
jgi:hypothetical protein